jgi:hypothetical protein
VTACSIWTLDCGSADWWATAARRLSASAMVASSCITGMRGVTDELRAARQSLANAIGNVDMLLNLLDAIA